MNGPLTVRLAESSDDAALCKLMHGISMPGQMELGASYTPSFFEAIEVEGERPHVIVGERDGKLAGCGLVAERNVYLNGVPNRIGYLSSLRLEPGIRSTTALSRGYQFLRHLENLQAPLPFSLSTIINGNDKAVEMLCSGRADLPRYVQCGRYTTHVIAVSRRHKTDKAESFRIRSGADLDPDTLCHLLNEWGAQRQFYPVYSTADLVAPDGILRGLHPEHFLVAFDPHDQPVGILACWDQMPFRRYVVKRYHGLLRFLYPLTRLAGHCLGRAILPPPARPVS